MHMDSVIAIVGLAMGVPAVVVLLVLMARACSVPDHVPEVRGHRASVHAAELLDRDREAVLHL
jgi:hypothetical protein